MNLGRPDYLWLLLILPAIPMMASNSLAGVGMVRMVLAAFLRCLVFVALILSLAQLERTRRVDDQSVVFVLDGSRSIPIPQLQDALDFVHKAVLKMRPGKDRVGVMGFAGDCKIEQLPGSRLNVETLDPAAQGDESDLSRALRLATALLPAETAGRIVVFSDGNENQGMALKEIETLAANNIPVDVLPCRYAQQNEVVFEGIASPTSAKKGEPTRLGFLLRSEREAKGKVLLYHDGVQVDLGPAGARSVTLHPGPNRLEEQVVLNGPGLHRFRAEFVPDDTASDGIANNNYAVSCTLVGGEDQVWILTDATASQNDEAKSAEILAEALRHEKINAQVSDLTDVTLDAAGLLQHSAVVLSNVPASSLGSEGQSALAAYVRDLGGGLVALGGDQSFSVGGYQETLLEAVLPVRTDRQKKQMLNTALVIVLDCSGSMAGQKLDIAKKSAIGSMELLSSLDYIGLVAFDSVPVWELPITLCGNKAGIRHRISAIGAGGGTNMYPALQMATAGLANAKAAAKLMILLTDGQSMPGDFEGITKKARESGITMSTIGVGPDADGSLLARLAKIGGGRFYPVDKTNILPRIFARETMLAGRTGIVEKTFTPIVRPTIGDTITTGIDPKSVPPLRGYVITSPRAEATMAMVRPTSEGEDPILAYWQIGLGKSVAFTSGYWPRWGAEWVEWPGFSKLWVQTIRWAARSFNGRAAEITTKQDGKRIRVTVNTPETGLTEQMISAVIGNVIDPANKSKPLVLSQVGRSEFEGSFTTDTPGNYVVQVAPHGGSAAGPMQISHAVIGIAYSPEYRELKSNELLLKELAERTGGRMLSQDKPEVVFDPTRIEPIFTHRSLSEMLLRIAIVLFLADIAVRRLVLDPAGMLRRLRVLIEQLAYRRRPVLAGESMAALRAVRDRTRTTKTSEGVNEGAVKPQTRFEEGWVEPLPGKAASVASKAELSEPGREVTSSESEVSATPRVPETEAEGSTGKLLAARRRKHHEK